MLIFDVSSTSGLKGYIDTDLCYICPSFSMEVSLHVGGDSQQYALNANMLSGAPCVEYPMYSAEH